MVAEQEPTKPEEKTIVKTTEAKGAAHTEPALPKNVEIGGITLQGGTIKFTDKSVKPTYTANLTQIGGRVSSLSMKKDTVADVEVRGKLNDYVPLEINGKVNPWKEHFFVDLTASTKDFELGPLSPYSGKYVGYTIDKGQLSFDLKYLIVQKKLESQNRILLDQFTFGDKVESPEATKLPVRLAVALLKDRKGQINLDIPVSGNIDDPKFSVWKVVWQIIGNLLVKAATSPFALLGALFGGGEELSYLEFDYGRANLAEPNLKKIDTVVKALDDRPALKLDIQGYVDVERDTEGLKNYLFQRKVRAQKLKELIKKGAEAAPVDDIKVEPNEYEKYLRLAYDAEKFPKPRNIVGLAKTLPVPEMEKLMLTNTIVKEEELRTLANQRASNVKDAILKSGKISSDRVFLVETKSLTPEKKENIKNSRVDFKLK
jgi:acylphosphatase